MAVGFTFGVLVAAVGVIAYVAGRSSASDSADEHSNRPTLSMTEPSGEEAELSREEEADGWAQVACDSHTEIDVIGDKVSSADDSEAVDAAANAARLSTRWQALYEALTLQAEIARFLQAQPSEFFDVPGGNPEVVDLGRERITIENECRKVTNPL